MAMASNTTAKILLIDDEPDITFTIKNILEDNGFEVVDSFTDPILALNNYKDNFYDLVILDIKMPKMDGFELYAKIREKDPKVKVCFLTAIATFGEERKIASRISKIIGIECFIQKPLKNDELLRKLISIIDKDIIAMPI
jgi:DNA-binding response OmpR family regulator